MDTTSFEIDVSASAVEAVARDLDRHKALFQIGEKVAPVSAMLRALTAERDALKALCVELVEALGEIEAQRSKTLRITRAALARARSILK